ncbi:MAG: superoxide dismutase family protein [Rhizobiaceae bacterium]|nr:superoxide dismutase family protein [Rhizobiaceae bacterium]MCV0404622.1 superoxide dismutase family protein [Rhizobiaceae bacterium]
MHGKILAVAAATVLSAGIAAAQQPAPSGAEASARMMNADGEEIGTVTFNQTKSGMLRLLVEISDLPPGPHGFHVHETGECEGDFQSAGGHYAGAGDPEHGVEAEGGLHAGDFPNVHVGQDGVLKVEFFTDRLSLADDAETPLIDDDGSAVMIHSGPDDYASQPAGDAGDRIACGVIEQPG